MGIIGYGGVGRLHCEAYAKSVLTEIVAIAEPDPERRALAAAALPVPVYADAEEMLRQTRLDIACVLAPAALHLALVRLCARAGVHVLCEKPLATTVEDAAEISRVCAAAGVALFYGSSYRFLAPVREARARIAAGAIGDVTMIREQEIGGAGIEARVTLPPAHYPAGTPGGSPMGLVDHGIHLLDVLPWLLQSPIASVFGRGNLSGAALRPEYAVLTFANGCTASLLYDEATFHTDLPAEGAFSWGSSWDASGYRPGGGWVPHPGAIHLHGTRGALRVFHYANTLIQFDADGPRQIALSGPAAPYHFAAQIDAFAQDLNDGAPARVSAGDAMRALQVLAAIYRSARERRVIDL
ncbi:MAG: Gfo/Idh/MocA family oxidoreductase [Rhizomicrobium sp.]